MTEVRRNLVRLPPHLTYVADADGAVLIEDSHSHCDILRYVVADIGLDETAYLLSQLGDGNAD